MDDKVLHVLISISIVESDFTYQRKYLSELRKVDILNKTVNYSAAQQSIQHLSQYCLVDIYKYWPVKSFGTRESR